MSMTDAAPSALQDLKVPDDLSLIELNPAEIELQQDFRVAAVAEVFADDPGWREAADWQAPMLERALGILNEAESYRTESQRLASLTGVEVPSLDNSTVVVRWPYAEEQMDVDIAIFEINDHVVVGFGSRWWLHYEAPQTDDIYDLEGRFWTELWGICSVLQTTNKQHRESIEEGVV